MLLSICLSSPDFLKFEWHWWVASFCADVPLITYSLSLSCLIILFYLVYLYHFFVFYFSFLFFVINFFYFKRWPYNAKAFPSTRTYLSKVNYYLQKNLFCCMVVWRCLQLYVYYMYTVSKKAVHLWYSIICGVHGRAWLSGPRGPEFSSGSGSLYSYMQVSLIVIIIVINRFL